MKKIAAFLLLALSASGWAESPRYDVHPVPLPGDAPMSLDYFAWDASSGRLWIPGGNTGYVFALGAKSRRLTAIRALRPGLSSATVGDGTVYVGSRSDANVCAIDTNTLELGACVKLTIGRPDGIAYVAATRELWVTMHGSTLDIIDLSDPRAPREKGTIALGASAEGYAVDEVHGVFYTNLEETNETIGIDVRTRKVIKRWKPGCDDARGLALDAARGFLFNACADRVIAIDVNNAGKVVGSIDTGAGLDNIDYSPSRHLLYAAAAKTGRLTIARVDEAGHLGNVAVVPTASGARGVVAGDGNTAYVADPINGRILVVTPR